MGTRVLEGRGYLLTSKQKQELRGEVGARAWRACGPPREGAWASAGGSSKQGVNQGAKLRLWGQLSRDLREVKHPYLSEQGAI
jgi:hypothetical protein